MHVPARPRFHGAPQRFDGHVVPDDVLFPDSYVLLCAGTTARPGGCLLSSTRQNGQEVSRGILHAGDRFLQRNAARRVRGERTGGCLRVPTTPRALRSGPRRMWN